MKEVFEFRLFESEAARLFEGEGRVLSSGLARLVQAAPDSVLYSRIRMAESTLSREGRHLIASWTVRRRYSARELDQAELLLVEIPEVFEPAGEESGTLYAEPSCSRCGARRQQLTALRLPSSSMPKGVDAARTIAGEIVVSERFAVAAGNARFSGLDLASIELLGPQRTNQAAWRQLVWPSAIAVAVPPSRFGISPFNLDDEGLYRCKGHVAGLRRLSELTVDLTNTQMEFGRASELVGISRGLLQPEPMLLAAARFYRFCLDQQFRGFRFEVVRIPSS